MTPVGLISAPKHTLIQMLADCEAAQEFLGVGNSSAAVERIRTEWTLGTVRELMPMIVVTLSRLELVSIAGGVKDTLWPSGEGRVFLVELFARDPGEPKIVREKVEQPALESGTLSVENALGQIIEQLAAQSSVDDKLTLGRISLNQPWNRSDPQSWPTYGSEVYAQFFVTVPI